MQNLQNDLMFESLISGTASVPSQEKLYTEVTINSKKIFSCLIPDCGKSFKFRSEMERHIVTHTGQRPFFCSFPGCGKSFKRNDALSNHFKIHTRNIHFSCPVPGCSSQFTTKSAARYHLLKHNGEKSFKCSFAGCTKSFLTYAQLQQHEKASYYHNKVSMSYSTMDQPSPIQLSVQESDGCCSLNNEQIYGHDSVDGFDNFDFADMNTIDFEELLNNQITNEPLDNTFNFPNNNYEQLDGKYEEMIPSLASTAGSEKPSVGNLSKRSLQDRLIDILDFVIEENQQLKKKLKYNTETVQNNCAEKDQMKGQDDVDLFFKSSFGSENKTENNSEFLNRYFFE
jgi:uncharacterized Zn-finger protein